MFSAKQGSYWYHFYNVFGMTVTITYRLTTFNAHYMYHNNGREMQFILLSERDLNPQHSNPKYGHKQGYSLTRIDVYMYIQI